MFIWYSSAFREKSEELSRELERLKKSMSAKEELERNQIEAVISIFTLRFFFLILLMFVRFSSIL